MGAGRRTQTFVLNDNTFSLSNTETSPMSYNASSSRFRNLEKSQLGGVIFGCTYSTMEECFNNQLFGLPAPHISYVKNISTGLPLFLFNYSGRKLHGIFEASSPGQLNIDKHAWTADGSQRTLYPAQVKIHTRLQCQALHEDEFKPLIQGNYYSPNHFWFELDHAQTSNLISLLSSRAFTPSSSTPQIAKERRIGPLTTQRRGEESEGFDSTVLNVGFARSCSSNDSSHSSEAYSDRRTSEENEKDVSYIKLEAEAFKHEKVDPPSIVEDGVVLNGANLEQEGLLGKKTTSDDKFERISATSSGDTSVMAQLIKEIEDLKAFKTEQSQKMEYLEQKLANAVTEIERIKDQCMLLESESISYAAIDDATASETCINESIYVLGGYDGNQWLSTLDSFSPSLDTVKSLRSMNSARSYASVARLNGEIYVCGGGNGFVWYNTVEAYNPTKDIWTSCPSMNEMKGSLSCATVNNKLFVLGGGNGCECFSDVEMLDPDVGRWIPAQSMLHKRFALSAVEHNGAIYAVGGFDGTKYLTSVERFDPREHSWTRTASMNIQRGCHSLTVMNGKIYALGGYDGSKMVSSIETFDPRMGSWMNGEPMNQPRGYAAAVVLKESMYIMGGVVKEETTIDTIECYKEDKGWQLTNLKALGSRCFASAIVSCDEYK